MQLGRNRPAQFNSLTTVTGLVVKYQPTHQTTVNELSVGTSLVHHIDYPVGIFTRRPVYSAFTLSLSTNCL